MATQFIKITAYVTTQEDLAKWKALSNKTEAIHQMLNSNPELQQAGSK